MKNKKFIDKIAAFVILFLVTSLSYGLPGDDMKGKKTKQPLSKVSEVNATGKNGDAYRMYINNINLPMNRKGVIAAVNIANPDTNIGGFGGKFANKVFLHSSGFFLSGYKDGNVWANAVASASLVEDYIQGTIAGGQADPNAVLYVLRSDETPFTGKGWVDWKDAVSLGADFYDGDGDGVYNPVDKNSNGKWDPDEDAPDMLGDETVWCVYNDGILAPQRRWLVDPIGIEIRQTVFGFSSAGPLGNIIFVRYRFKYVGLQAADPDKLSDVYFGVWADPDLGFPKDDLVGCDTTRDAGYVYNKTPDAVYGNQPPCFMFDFLSGPIGYFAGETYTDANSNGRYDEGIDTPLDTAYSYRGQMKGIVSFPGGKNLKLSSFVMYMNSDPDLSDPSTKFEARNYMLGLQKNGTPVNVCSFGYGQVKGGVNCALVNNRFWFSGDPVKDIGWLNSTPTDQRLMQNIGTFELEKNIEKEVTIAMIVGQGSNPLDGITVAKTFSDSAQFIFNKNFTNPKITLIQPNGGENWNAGTSHNIQWQYTNISNIKIEYTTNNGAEWVEIISNTPAIDGQYTWNVPNTPSSQCKVRIIDISNLSIADVSDNSFTILDTATITLIQPNGGENWQAGTQKNIQWTYCYINNIKIEYTTDGGSSWLEISAITPAIDGQYTWTVPNTTSAQCKVRVSDTGTSVVQDISENNFTIFIYPQSVNINNTVTFGEVTDLSNYKIVGLPGNNNIPVSLVMTGDSPYDWNAFWDNGAASEYQVKYDGSDVFKFTSGKAFWLLSKNQVVFSTSVGSVTLSGDNSYSIPLHNGWNLISNPFEKNVSWSSVQAVNSGIQPIHVFNKTFSVSSVFEPYKGYYFNNAANLTSLKIPYPVTGPVPSVMNKSGDQENYYLRLSLQNTTGEQSTVEIRNDINGENGFDAKDIFAPPGDFEKLRISIRNNEVENSYKYLMRDNRNLAEEEEFEVIVKNMTGNVVRLKTELPEKLIHEKVYLVEKSKGKFTDLLSEEGVLISPNHPGDEFVLLLGSESFIESKKSEYLPKDFMLYQNYPNPFNPTTVISYQLAVNSFVRLELFSVAGEKIATLVNKQQEAGYYNYQLSTVNYQLSSGVYFYQLRAGELVSTKKLILMK